MAGTPRPTRATSDSGLVVAIDDARAEDVQALLQRHLAFARDVTPEGHVHAMEADALVDPAIIVFGAREDGVLLGIGALRGLDSTHAELKSMHTSEQARSHGVGRAVVLHILDYAAAADYRRVSLETGTMEAFAPARSLYASVGFSPCEPFGEYWSNPHSTCMTLLLER